MPERAPLAFGKPPRWQWLLAALVVHVLLVAGLVSSWRTAWKGQMAKAAVEGQPHSAVRMITVNLPALPRPKRVAPGATGTTSVRVVPPLDRHARASAPMRPERPSSTLSPPPASLADATAQPLTAISAASAASTPPAAPVAPVASGPSGRELMNGDATRLAIRQVTQGTPLLSERADDASRAPDRLDASARLGREIKNAGAGDCLKGEYAGAGAGLLSAPFLLLAQARGRCAK